jgi:hypothetical protein
LWRERHQSKRGSGMRQPAASRLASRSDHRVRSGVSRSAAAASRVGSFCRSALSLLKKTERTNGASGSGSV